MFDFSEAARLVRLQEKVRRNTIEALREDGHHKSSEAHVEMAICLPGMFSDNTDPYWQISVYSYVLGPHRNHSWVGRTPSEALAVAEEAIQGWCDEWEMKAFSRSMDMVVPQEDDIEDEIPPAPGSPAADRANRENKNDFDIPS